MPKFRKKPVVIEAVRVQKPYRLVREFCPKAVTLVCGSRVSGYVIVTLEGEMRADLGDWIIKGVKGEFYPCKPDVFEATYEAVEEGK